MKYFVFVFALLFAGCDLFGIQSEANTITYKLESTSTKPLITTAISYLAGSDDEDNTGIEITEYPWETSVPYFQGPKALVAFSNGEGLTLTILHNGEVIAKSTNVEISTEQEPHIIGAVAHAASYDIETTLSGVEASFSTNFLELEGESDYTFPSEHWGEVIEDHRSVNPGDHLHIEKSAGRGLLEINLKQPRWVNLAMYSGPLPASVDIQMGIAE